MTYVVVATMVAGLLAVTSPPAAAQAGGRAPQPIDSTPVQPVAGAGVPPAMCSI